MTLWPYGSSTSGGRKEQHNMAHQIITCECGLKWNLRRVKIIARDSDSANCTCGRELIRWSGGHMWIRDDKPIEDSK